MIILSTCFGICSPFQETNNFCFVRYVIPFFLNRQIANRDQINYFVIVEIKKVITREENVIRRKLSTKQSTEEVVYNGNCKKLKIYVL